MANCTNCGGPLAPGMDRCARCGTMAEQPQAAQPYSPQVYQPAYGVQAAPKSKVVAILLALFLGQLGIHNFYLGYTGKGVAQLLITLILGWFFFIGCIISSFWALVELIMIAAGAINTDAQGNPLV